MTIRLPHSCFIHVPRTGGIWLESSLARIGHKMQILKGDIDSHLTCEELPQHWKHLPTFSFIRHPLSWIRSRWSHAQKINAVADQRHFGIHREFDRWIEATFEGTVENIVNYCPGLVTSTFDEMQHGVDYLCCTEELPHAAYKLLLNLEGIPLDIWTEEIEVPPVNTSSEEYGQLLALPPELENEFIKSEQSLIDRWDGAHQCK